MKLSYQKDTNSTIVPDIHSIYPIDFNNTSGNTRACSLCFTKKMHNINDLVGLIAHTLCIGDQMTTLLTFHQIIAKGMIPVPHITHKIDIGDLMSKVATILLQAKTIRRVF